MESRQPAGQDTERSGNSSRCRRSRDFGVLLHAGCRNEHAVFLIADSQIVHEQMLEDINNILNTGEINNLMEQEHVDKIIESVRDGVKRAGKGETRAVMLQHFVLLRNVFRHYCTQGMGTPEEEDAMDEMSVVELRVSAG